MPIFPRGLIDCSCSAISPRRYSAILNCQPVSNLNGCRKKFRNIFKIFMRIKPNHLRRQRRSSEMGDKVFAFTHQTFLEYFFALHIDEMHDSVKEVLNQVLPKVSRGEWDMVSHLSLQIKTYRNLRRQNEAIELLVENRAGPGNLHR